MARIEPAFRMIEVLETVKDCERCSLFQVGHGPIPFHTPTMPPVKVCVVGEAPGKEEDEAEIPFVGPAGRTLHSWMEGAGLKTYAVLNAVSCYPGRTPHSREVEACRTNLIAQLDFLDPEYVLVLGGVALNALFPTEWRIGTMRGLWWTLQISSTKSAQAMATWHPAAVLRNLDLGDEARQDIAHFASKANE